MHFTYFTFVMAHVHIMDAMAAQDFLATVASGVEASALMSLRRHVQATSSSCT